MQPPAGDEEIYRLPDDIFLLILSHVSTDIKSLARCSVVSSRFRFRFRFLVSLVPSLLIHVNQIFSFHREILPFTIRVLVSEISLQPMTYLTRYSPHPRSIIHRVPINLLKKFSNLRSLHIDLSSGEINLDRCTSATSSPTLFHWHAHFGSSLNRCLIIGATSFSWIGNEETDVADYDYVTRKWAYKDIAVLWANVALIAASSRHQRLQRTVKEHANIESLVVTDADGQGVFRMYRDQLKELRKGPVLASSANERTMLRQRWGWMGQLMLFSGKERTMVPPTRRWEWFASMVKLSCGQVLKGVTLSAVLASSGGEKGEDEMGLGWINEEFDGMYAEVVRVMLKRSPDRHYETKTGY